LGEKDMARKKVGVTLKNLYRVYIYFENALKDGRLWRKREVSEEARQKAQEGFAALPLIRAYSMVGRRQAAPAHHARTCAALQGWIDEWVSAEQWTQCLKTLRYYEACVRDNRKRVDLPFDTHWLVKKVAGQMKLSIAKTIAKLARDKLDALDKAAEKAVKI
jgi:hypothetical protein